MGTFLGKGIGGVRPSKANKIQIKPEEICSNWNRLDGTWLQRHVSASKDSAKKNKTIVTIIRVKKGPGRKLRLEGKAYWFGAPPGLPMPCHGEFETLLSGWDGNKLLYRYDGKKAVRDSSSKIIKEKKNGFGVLRFDADSLGESFHHGKSGFDHIGEYRKENIGEVHDRENYLKKVKFLIPLDPMKELQWISSNRRLIEMVLFPERVSTAHSDEPNLK